MKPSVRLAGALIRLWSRLYTLGLHPDQAACRRAMIDSDVWEQSHDAPLSGEAAIGPGISLIWRALRGIPADLSWRLAETGASRPISLDPSPEGSTIMQPCTNSTLPLLLVTAATAWMMTLTMAIVPLEHSLAYGGGLLVLVSALGWILEMRRADVSLEPEAMTSAWPLLLAVAIAILAAGLLIDSSVAGPAVTLALALVATAGLTRRVIIGMLERPEASDQPLLSDSQVAQRLAGGQALVLERANTRRLSRRAVLRGSVWLGLGSVVAAMGGTIVDFLWQRNVSGFGGVVVAGSPEEFPPGSKTRVREGKFWLVHLTQEQGGPGFLALWQKCPHLGCVVPWEEGFSFVDPVLGNRKKGWFRCPCHQSTYDNAGVRVYGPAPRSMDRMAVRIIEGQIEVDTADIAKGTPDNAAHAVKPEAG